MSNSTDESTPINQNRIKKLIVLLLKILVGGVIIMSILFIGLLYFLDASGYLDDLGPMYSYESDINRIEPVNLNELEKKLESESHNYTITRENVFTENAVFHLGNRTITIHYVDYRKNTDIHYILHPNNTEILNNFFEKTGYYFYLSENEMSEIRKNASYSSHILDSVSLTITGRPVWQNIYRDIGDDYVSDNSKVGRIDFVFSEIGTHVYNVTDNLKISKSTLQENGDLVHMELLIDTDTDFEVIVYSNSPIEEPMSYVQPLFEALDIGLTTDEITLEEHVYEGL